MSTHAGRPGPKQGMATKGGPTPWHHPNPEAMQPIHPAPKAWGPQKKLTSLRHHLKRKKT